MVAARAAAGRATRRAAGGARGRTPCPQLAGAEKAARSFPASLLPAVWARRTGSCCLRLWREARSEPPGWPRERSAGQLLASVAASRGERGRCWARVPVHQRGQARGRFPCEEGTSRSRVTPRAAARTQPAGSTTRCRAGSLAQDGLWERAEGTCVGPGTSAPGGRATVRPAGAKQPCHLPSSLSEVPGAERSSAPGEPAPTSSSQSCCQDVSQNDTISPLNNKNKLLTMKDSQKSQYTLTEFLDSVCVCPHLPIFSGG